MIALRNCEWHGFSLITQDQYMILKVRVKTNAMQLVLTQILCSLNALLP